MVRGKHGDPLIHIRIPDELREEIVTMARAAGRTMNSEVLMALQHWARRSIR